MAVPDGISGQQRRVLELRAEFLKKSLNPYRHATMEGGHVFDPAFYRFQAMRSTQWDNFKATPKNFKFGFLAVVLPVGLFYYLIKNERDTKEEKFRTGQVAYKDRSFKFI
ncbi:unnamed protein product [Chironomus riparius]|uniref:NADH dehydrogenase [ubiquinone] 1 beta subcomplex subunit 4 n=1 Tax=Chironomus riparius TaxID=315576 RepID=A0A9N9WUA8_9DIPT|nr:unnamed protein product [Chironomus riparius]